MTKNDYNVSKNAYWAAIRRSLAIWEHDRVKFAFDDPPKFSRTKVNSEIFPDVLDHLVNTDSGLSKNNLIRLIETFSHSCHKSEWENFYQPALRRQFTDGYTLGKFNIDAPEEFHIKPFRPQSHAVGVPRDHGFYYPCVKEYQRVFVFVWKTCIETTTEKFTLWDHPNLEKDFEAMIDQKDVEYPLVFEGYSNGHEVILTDFFPLPQIHQWPGKIRRMALEEAFINFLSENELLVLGEGLPAAPNEINHIEQALMEMGHNTGMLFKSATQTYLDPAIFVHTET